MVPRRDILPLLPPPLQNNTTTTDCRGDSNTPDHGVDIQTNTQTYNKKTKKAVILQLPSKALQQHNICQLKSILLLAMKEDFIDNYLPTTINRGCPHLHS